MRWIALVFVVGCGGSGPNSGTWKYEGVAVAEDTCNAGDQVSQPDGEFYIRNNDDGTFSVDPNDDTDVFDCNLDGGSFDCPDRVTEEYSDSNGTLTVRGTASGDVSKDEGSGSQIGTVDCEGSGCASIAALFGTTFPCSVTWDFNIAYVDDDQGEIFAP